MRSKAPSAAFHPYFSRMSSVCRLGSHLKKFPMYRPRTPTLMISSSLGYFAHDRSVSLRGSLGSLSMSYHSKPRRSCSCRTRALNSTKSSGAYIPEMSQLVSPHMMRGIWNFTAMEMGKVMIPQWACQFMSPILRKHSRLSFFNTATLGPNTMWSASNTWRMRSRL